MLLISLVIVLTTSGCSERKEVFYKTYAEAVSGGAMEGGWLPTFFPKSAREIYERHDLDTNEVWVHFVFSGQEVKSVPNSCFRIESDQVIYPRVNQVKNINWWPKDIQDRSGRSYEFYQCTHGIKLQGSSKQMKSFLAIEGSQDGKAWYWVVNSPAGGPGNVFLLPGSAGQERFATAPSPPHLPQHDLDVAHGVGPR